MHIYILFRYVSKFIFGTPNVIVKKSKNVFALIAIVSQNLLDIMLYRNVDELRFLLITNKMLKLFPRNHNLLLFFVSKIPCRKY
jgi:hypothetical protein